MKTENNKLINSVNNDNSPVADPAKRRPGRPKKSDPVPAQTITTGKPGKRNAAAKTTNNNLPVQPKKHGRPKGSKNSVKIKRPDKAIACSVHTEPGENTKYILHDMKLSNLPCIDMNNNTAVSSRINQYFTICAEDDIKPSVASLALAFGFSRFVLFDMLNGRNKSITNSESLHTIKKAYDSINSYYEHMMNNGKINPVAGIFLMKNNMGYKDTTDHVITTGDDTRMNIDDITNRAGLLD